jgi:hypothetical protein
MSGCGLVSTGSVYDPVADFCEHSNGPSCSTKGQRGGGLAAGT